MNNRFLPTLLLGLMTVVWLLSGLMATPISYIYYGKLEIQVLAYSWDDYEDEEGEEGDETRTD